MSEINNQLTTAVVKDENSIKIKDWVDFKKKWIED